MSDRLNINIQKALGSFSIQVKQSLPLDGITAIFGPSGAGKSSLLKLIAGFEAPDNGHISLREIIWFDKADKIIIPPHKRPVGYMFQDGRLFPHLTVRHNLDFAAKRASRTIAIADVVSAFDLDHLLDNAPTTLSGGERRRVALARTVLTVPDILLLDEPLTGLDRARKRDILPFIERLPNDFNIPCLYVTHDIEEVSRLADKVMVMSGGNVSTFGAVADILGHLDTTPLHSDYDISSLFEGRITAHDEGLHMMQADIDGADIYLPEIANARIGDKLRLRIRASDVALSLKRPKGVSIRNILAADISDIIADEASAHAVITLIFKGKELRARITRAALQDLNLTKEMKVFALIKSVSFEGRL